MPNQPELCPCGQPLHYKSAALEKYICDFIKEWGPVLEMNVRGKNVYEVPIHFLAIHGMKETFEQADNGRWPKAQEGESPIPDDKVIELISVISGAPAAPTAVYKLPDDPQGLIRVSLGGGTKQAVYVTYRGNINEVARLMEICLNLVKIQAEKGEAPPPTNPKRN